MRCYLLSLASGSSLDQQSNNVTLFNLVEQLNFPPSSQPRPGALLPIEIHAYFQLDPDEVSRRFELRFAIVESSGLETVTETFQHKSSSPRFRTRTLGLPAPPAPGSYQLRVDFKMEGGDDWTRDSVAWPLRVARAEPRPQVTH